MKARIFHLLELILNLSDEFDSIISDFLDQVKEVFSVILKGLLELYIYIARPLYIVVFTFGLAYYVVTGFNYRAKRYVIGGILLAVFTELFLPRLIEFLSG